MDAAVDAAGQVPDAPRVDVAEHEVTGLGLGTGAVDVVEDPLDLRPREVGRERQADLRAQAVLAAVLGELVDDHVGPRVLPDDRVVNGLAGVPVPDDSGLALVGDADGREVRGGDAGLVERAADDFLAARPDLRRVVLDPARLGVDLLVLLLVDGDHLPAMIEDHEAGAGRALVEGANILWHPVPPVLRTRRQLARPSWSRSASKRIVALVAPGSWWPADRSPR